MPIDAKSLSEPLSLRQSFSHHNIIAARLLKFHKRTDSHNDHPCKSFCTILAGILTGANMSGDLRDPQKSIPAGTILAQLTCSFIFLLLVFFYGGTTQADVLRDKYHQFIVRILTSLDRTLLSTSVCPSVRLSNVCTLTKRNNRM